MYLSLPHTIQTLLSLYRTSFDQLESNVSLDGCLVRLDFCIKVPFEFVGNGEEGV